MGEKTPQPIRQVNACAKPLFRGEKCRLERLFILAQRTYDVLKVMFGGVKHVNSKRYEYLSDLKAIEMQYGLLKT